MPAIQTQSEVVALDSDPPLPRSDWRHHLVALDLAELCTYRELFHFFDWRDVNIRYEQDVCAQ
jgi:hypothetical protein